MAVSRLALLLTAASLGPALAAGSNEGMPQLAFDNPLTISQVVWMLVIFAGLYFVLANWALPRVSEVLDARAKRISDDLAAAQRAKATADTAVAELTEATRTARARSQAAIADATAKAQAAAAADAEEVNARLAEQLAAAEGRIASAQRTAMGALREVAMETTGTLVARLAGVTPDPAVVERAVGSALAARRQG